MVSPLSLILLGSLTSLSAEKAYYMPEERPFPCVAEVTCETVSEFDDTLTQISVDYYDDLGTKFHWTQQLHRLEDFDSCEQAMTKKFPYAFFKRCQVEK